MFYSLLFKCFKSILVSATKCFLIDVKIPVFQSDIAAAASSKANEMSGHTRTVHRPNEGTSEALSTTAAGTMQVCVLCSSSDKNKRQV